MYFEIFCQFASSVPIRGSRDDKCHVLSALSVAFETQGVAKHYVSKNLYYFFSQVCQ